MDRKRNASAEDINDFDQLRLKIVSDNTIYSLHAII